MSLPQSKTAFRKEGRFLIAEAFAQRKDNDVGGAVHPELLSVKFYSVGEFFQKQ